MTAGRRCAAALALGLAFGACASPPRPNVVLVMCDDLGWGDVGFNGGTAIPTPNLDAMAAHSLRFERFYAAAPVCSPTRGSVVTGRHPYRYGIRGANKGHLPAAEQTIYEALGAAGYATGHFGKWHMGTLTKTVRESNRGGPRGVAHHSPPWQHGVDVSFATEAKTPTFDPMRKPKGAGRQWWSAIADGEPAMAYGTHYWTGAEQMVDPAAEELRGDDSAIIMHRARRFIADVVVADRPFLAVVWLHAPHLPVVAPGATDFAHCYRTVVTALDAEVGMLRAQLRALGVANDTILAFCSDNGPEGVAGQAPGSAGPLRGRKRDLLEGGIRVPGLIEWPARIRAGRSTAVPCGTVDYLPTILAAAGLDPVIDRPLDGINLLPLLDGEMQQRSIPLGFQSGRQAAWIGDRYKIHSIDGGATFALYDLVADPGESKDLAAAHPEVVREMRAAFEAWRAACEASSQGADY